MTAFDPVYGFVPDVPNPEVVELRAQIATLEESFDEAAQTLLRIRAEGEGWSILGQVRTDDGFSLRVVKDIAKKAEVQSLGNPLLKHGFDLRYNPIFSRKFTLAFTEGDRLKPRYQRKIDNVSVQDVLFSAEGLEALERTCYNVGNLFVMYNRLTGDMMRIPFDEIGNRAINPDLPTQTAYYLWNHTRHDFNGKSTPISEWVPVVEWQTAGRDTIDEIAHLPVNHDWTIIDMRVNVPTTGHWGIPDVFAALPYAWAYSEYIRDAASLLKALNTIAWKVVGKSKTQAQAGGVAIAGARKTGGVAAMTAGTELAAMPKAGQVDMADGQAMAAMVASALGVSTNALLTVSSGGTSAAVQALDGPTVAMARARQERWTHFYERVFAAMGIEDVSINFPKITEDPIYRTVASLATGRATGAIWADEYRAAFLEAMSTSPLHTDAPPVEEYAQAQNALGFIAQMSDEINAQNAENDPLARQGNSGVAGKLGETDNAGLRKRDNGAASGTQTDLVG